jgi:hypothetical protein
MLRVILLAAALALSIIGAPLAHADSHDDQYLSALAGLGINTAPADQLITAGHTTCDSMGNPFQGLAAQGQFLSAGVPYGQITPVEIAPARAYCPDKLHSVGLS